MGTKSDYIENFLLLGKADEFAKFTFPFLLRLADTKKGAENRGYLSSAIGLIWS